MSHIVYRLTPLEFDRYRTHLLALDNNSRRMRFGVTLSDDSINKLCDNMQAHIHQHRIFVIENQQLEVVAAGHIAIATDQPMELAFSVLEQYRRQHMADSLMKRCINWCQNRGYSTGYMVCLRENDAMKALARKHGLVMTSQDGETEAHITLPVATAYSVIFESLDNSLSMFDHVGKLHGQLVTRWHTGSDS
jgi:GNAT superfamily N-acetyltransferase